MVLKFLELLMEISVVRKKKRLDMNDESWVKYVTNYLITVERLDDVSIMKLVSLVKVFIPS